MQNLTYNEKKEIFEILKNEIKIWDDLHCKKKRTKPLQKAISIISKYLNQEDISGVITNINDKITFGNYILEDDIDEHFDFIKDNNIIEHIKYEDRILLFNNGSYNLMTGTNCEHFNSDHSPYKATKYDRTNFIYHDNWTNASWKTSNRLFTEKKIWDSISKNEKNQIEKQGWKIHIARGFKTMNYKDNIIESA